MTIMRSRSHHPSLHAGRHTTLGHTTLDRPTIPLLDSSFLPAEEDWSVVGQALAYCDAHAHPDDAQELDFAIEPEGLD